MEVITDGDGAASGTEVVDQNNQAISVVHVAIPNQPVQVQSVIHPNQPSVIQTTGGGGAGGNMQTIQVSDLQTAPHHRQSDKQQYQILQVYEQPENQHLQQGSTFPGDKGPYAPSFCHEPLDFSE